MSRIVGVLLLVALLVVGAIVASTWRSGAPGTASSVVDSLPSPARPGSAEPYLALAPDGLVYMSWLEPVDSGHALRFAVLDDEQWSAPRTIRTGRDFFVNWADFPSIEVLDDGQLAAHWLQRTGSGTYAYGVRISRSADGGNTWSAPITPHRDSSDTEHGFVAMWPDGDGRLGAAWLDGRNFTEARHNASNEMMLLSTTIGPDGELGPETRIDERTCDCCQNSAAMTDRGPVVAYRDRSPGEIRDIRVARREGAGWSEGRLVHADNWKIDACPVNGPAIAASGSRVAVAWFTAANDSARVQLAFSDDAGATFHPRVRVDGGSPAGRVDVELLEDGSALVTWIERVGGETAAVRARIVASDGTPGAATTIASSSAARASGFPRVVTRDSEALFAWTVPGTPSAVRVARVALDRFR